LGADHRLVILQDILLDKLNTADRIIRRLGSGCDSPATSTTPAFPTTLTIPSISTIPPTISFITSSATITSSYQESSTTTSKTC
jgi:hypothetical protein